MDLESMTEQGIRDRIIYTEAKRQADRGIWCMDDGTIVHVEDMSDGDIQTCLAELTQGDSRFAEPFIRMFEDELKWRMVYVEVANEKITRD